MKCIANGINRANQSALHYLQSKRNMDILCLCSLLFTNSQVFGHCIIKTFLFLGEIIRHSLGISVFIKRIAIPILHVFFQATDKELITSILAQLPYTFCRQIICSKNIFIQQLHQEFESILSASMRCCCQQK